MLARVHARWWDAPELGSTEELISAGISKYSFDDLLLDYRRGLVRNLTFPILFWSRGRPREDWRYRLDCALAAYRDHDCVEVL